VLASSIAMIGFGLDSVIEFFAAAVVAWQLHGEEEERETRAVWLIGVRFFALALYLAVEGVRDLATHARPGQSAADLAPPDPPQARPHSVAQRLPSCAGPVTEGLVGRGGAWRG
jgi:hypothetical protein